MAVRRRPTRVPITGGIVAPGTVPANEQHPLAALDTKTRERRFLKAAGALLEVAATAAGEPPSTTTSLPAETPVTQNPEKT